MKIHLVILLIGFISPAKGQEDLLLQKIADLQVEEHGFYKEGFFPAKIVPFWTDQAVEDDNIFFQGLILYTLQSIRDSLNPEDRLCIDRMEDKVLPLMKYYRNRNGDITYNFYQVHPDNPFPNVPFFSDLSWVRVADDLDNTSILYLVMDSPDSLNRALHAKMAAQSFTGKKLISSFPKYRDSRAYRSWFADKMEQDLDLCVMANVLVFVFEKNLPLGEVDFATIDLIKEMVKNDEHLRNEHLVSPHYQNTAIILYHLARLIDVADHPGLNELKPRLIKDIRSIIFKSENAMEQVILLTSLYRLGESMPFSMDLGRIESEMDYFYWFYANPLYGYWLWLKQLIGRSRFLQMAYRSEAYYWSLVLELQILTNSSISINQEGHPVLTNFSR